MDTKQLLEKLTIVPGVSGYEKKVAGIIQDILTPYVDQVRLGKLGSVICCKKGTFRQRPLKVMLAAHMDEIGLVVTKIEREGFLRFATVGGVDQRTLPGQEVTVHGQHPLPGIIGAKPPHVQEPGEQEKAYKLDRLFIDTGLPEEQVKQIVSVGDFITVNRTLSMLNNNIATGKALDDRAGVAVLFECLKELQQVQHGADIYAVATVQEEVGYRGAMVSAYGISPHIGIAIDVCHGNSPGVPEDKSSILGDGPVLGIGPHVHHKLFAKLVETAQDRGIKYQLNPSPSPEGTDTWALQINQAGLPTALISIPLRYMHTSVEAVSLDDIKQAGRLIAHTVSTFNWEFVEGLSCY